MKQVFIRNDLYQRLEAFFAPVEGDGLQVARWKRQGERALTAYGLYREDRRPECGPVRDELSKAFEWLVKYQVPGAVELSRETDRALSFFHWGRER